MNDLLKEFRDFALKGNLIELGIALVLALAFKSLISSFVDALLMPIVGVIFGEPRFDSLTFTINNSIFFYGSFITVLIEFILIAAAIFFLVIKPYNAIIERRRSGDGDDDQPAPDPEELTLLRQIAVNTADD
jgi:large conductance mechanosensitive channel